MTQQPNKAAIVTGGEATPAMAALLRDVSPQVVICGQPLPEVKPAFSLEPTVLSQVGATTLTFSSSGASIRSYRAPE